MGQPKAAYIASARTIPNIVFAGAIGSSEGGGGNMYAFDRRNRNQRMITVWPQDQYGSAVIDVKYRFYFTFLWLLSPHDPNALYAAAQYVFRSTDMGTSWQIISPDLTRDDKSHMTPIDGGPITSQSFSSQYTSTIYSFAESPLKAGELWAGTDDGSIHYSPDNGKTWLDRSPKDLPEWTGIYLIEVSSHNPGTVYIAANRHELDDHNLYFEKTTDYGKTWQRINNGIAPGDYAWVIREDPVRPGLLYAGTEGGVYVSFDDGAQWQSLRRNMPVVAVRDMVVKDNDLIAASHGRAFWILDNISPLREITPEVTQSAVHLFDVPVTYRLMAGGFGGGGFGQMEKFGPEFLRVSGDGIALHETQEADGTMTATYLNAGMNPPRGVVVTYYLKQKPEGPVTLTFLDARGQEIEHFSSGQQGGPRVPAAAGTNRFVWNMDYPNARQLPRDGFAAVEWENARAPLAVPGTYRVRLSADGQNSEQNFVIREDPRVDVSQQDLQAQFDLMLKIRDEINTVTDTVNQIRKVREQVDAAAKQSQGRPGVQEAATKLDGALAGVEGELVRMINPVDPMMVHPKTLNIRLAALTTVVESADAVPTKQSYDVFDHLTGQVNDELNQLKPILAEQVSAFLKMAGSSAAPANSSVRSLRNERHTWFEGRGAPMKSERAYGTLFLAVAIGLLCAGCGSKPAQAPAYPANVDPGFLQALRWRSIGPPRGGRVNAVAGDPQNPLVFYLGSVGGGVWKSYDAGRYWQNISDPYFKTGSIGAMAVAPSNPNVIYVGTGEALSYPDMQGGDGVYKSTDAGKTWVNVGLQETQHIAKIAVSPHDPNLVYVAAFGHKSEANPDRGVYRSKDGGEDLAKGPICE